MYGYIKSGEIKYIRVRLPHSAVFTWRGSGGGGYRYRGVE